MKTIAFVALVAAVALTEARPNVSNFADPPNDNTTFSKFYFEVSTRPGSCKNSNCHRLSKGQTLPLWTIGGLHPAKKSGKPAPVNCNTNATFKLDDLKPLKDNLTRFFPNFRGGNDKLWQEEFNKYGKCALNGAPALNNSAVNYFNQTLILFAKYNVSDYLEKAGIKPNDTKTISTDDIRKAIILSPGTFELVCGEKFNGTDLLRGIRICLSKTFYLNSDCTLPDKDKCGSEVYYMANSSSLSVPSLLAIVTATFLALFASRR